jgi:mRNA-degrading endonuclease RelE of RelBE toxin-antitoxin system
MSYEINPTKTFLVEVKKLRKRYHSLEADLEDFKISLQANPLQGSELCPGIRKIRMPITSKGRGKSGSARVITANAIVAEHEGRIALLTIYDKADASTVKLNVIKKMASELGF